MMAKATSIRFDDNLYDTILAYSQMNNQSISSFVSEAVATYVADNGVQPDAKSAIDDYVDRFAPLLEKLKDK